MKTLLLTLLKVAMPILLLAIAFWPNLGLAWYIFNNFTSMPALWTVVIAVWFALMALNLPLRQDQFRWVTTGSLLAMSGAVIWVLASKGMFELTSLSTWGITSIVVVGTILGWWTVSVPLLRSWRGLFATDPNDQPIEG